MPDQSFPVPDLNDPELIEDVQESPVLYHYTSTAGFFAIINGGCTLRATHHRFLNDSGEVKFGAELIKAILVEIEGEIGTAVLSEVCRQVDEMVCDSVFVASLSQRHDILSQWRAYADNGKGYCIGLRFAERLRAYFGPDDESLSYQLIRCTYGEAETKKHIAERARRKLALVSSHAGDEDHDKWLVRELAKVAWRCLCMAKHEHFREEAEWRLIVGCPDDEVEYRLGTRSLVPFVETEPFAVETVWLGPSAVFPEIDVAKKNVEAFLRKHGVNATVQHWASTLR